MRAISNRLRAGFLLILLCGYLGAVRASAQAGKQPAEWWFPGDLAALQQAANAEEKFYFVEVSTTPCRWCTMLEQELNADSSARAYLQQYYLAKKADISTADGRRLQRTYGVRQFPTVLLFSPQGEMIVQSEGYLPAKLFVDMLEEYRREALTAE